MELALIGLAGTLFGGVVLKIIEHFLSRNQRKDTLAAELRKELREDLVTIKKELKEESEESEQWRSRYWEIKAELLMVNHKTNEAVKVIDSNHPEEHLGEQLEGLEYPGGKKMNPE